MYEYDSRVRLTEVDQDRKMTLTGILNAFQDCSTFHSEDLGVGLGYLEERSRMWVLRSWDIRIFSRPKLAERIRVGTWPYAFGKVTGQRNFRLLDAGGNLAACADSDWVYMDTVRMRPVRIEEEVGRIYGTEPQLFLFQEEEAGAAIRIPEDLEKEVPFDIHVWHLDVNHHVNNGQYVQLAGAYLPKDFTVGRMKAEYKKPAVLGDRIYPRVGREGDCFVVLLEDAFGKPYAVIEFGQE